MAKILYVEDDLNLSYVTKDSLEMAKHNVCHCANGLEALEILEKEPFDLCILDIMLPKVDGFEIAETIRKKDNNVPILFLSAKSLNEDKIKGLKMGADDYITKPFSIEELLLKIEIFLKRSKVESVVHDTQKEYRISNFIFDHSNLKLKLLGENYQLTTKEADLLRLFCIRKDELIKREDILNELWGDDDYFMGRSLDVFISRLRSYLKADNTIEIENIHGVGFRLKTKK